MKKGRRFKKKEKKTYNILIFIFTWFFLLCFLAVAFSLIFFNQNDLVHFRMIPSLILGGAFLGILILIYSLVKRDIMKVTLVKKHFRITILIFFIVLLLLQIILVKGIYFLPGWDVGGLIDHSINIVDNPEKFNSSYFMIYPNNLFLMLIFSKIYSITKLCRYIDFTFILVIINVIFVDLTIFVTFITAKKIYGKKVAVIILLVFTSLFAFSPWLVIPYSDTLSMLFPILIFYLYICEKQIISKAMKSFYILLMAVLSVVGLSIKPTVIISIIAIVISELLFITRKKKNFLEVFFLIFILSLGGITTSFIVNKFTSNIVVNSVNLDNRDHLEVPFTHFIMMGMQSVTVENRGTIYGAYDEDDVRLTNSKHSKEEKIEANIEEIKKRLKNFGIKGYIEFLAKKVNWFLSDGTFYYGGEGNFIRQGPYAVDDISIKMQNYYNHENKDYFKLANILQGFWSVIIILIAYPVFVRDKDYNNREIFVIRLNIVGIILFLAFFEARSRYLINHLPYFLLLFGYGFIKISDKYEELVQEDKIR